MKIVAAMHIKSYTIIEFLLGIKNYDEFLNEKNRDDEIKVKF